MVKPLNEKDRPHPHIFGTQPVYARGVPLAVLPAGARQHRRGFNGVLITGGLGVLMFALNFFSSITSCSFSRTLRRKVHPCLHIHRQCHRPLFHKYIPGAHHGQDDGERIQHPVFGGFRILFMVCRMVSPLPGGGSMHLHFLQGGSTTEAGSVFSPARASHWRFLWP